MTFFSGFALKDEAHFFSDLIIESDFSVVGFSYGAIKAIEYALTCNRRIDRLYLLSPAFFETKSERFKTLQLRAFDKNSSLYIQNFIANCFSPYEVEEVALDEPKKESLEQLLYYVYSHEKLDTLVQRGVEIITYIGGSDTIIDAKGAKAFFVEYGKVYYIKEANHFLRSRCE